MNKYKKKAINKLLETKMEDVAVFEVLELYLTERITVNKEKFRSQDLAKLQQKIEETQRFIKFLRTLK